MSFFAISFFTPTFHFQSGVSSEWSNLDTIKPDAQYHLDYDSFFVFDTIAIYDPETFTETLWIERNKLSTREYYIDQAIDPYTIVDTVYIYDPKDYSESMIIYDYGKNIIDTVFLNRPTKFTPKKKE